MGGVVAGVEVGDPGFGELGVEGLLLGAEGEEEFFDLVEAGRGSGETGSDEATKRRSDGGGVGADEEVVGEAGVEAPSFDADGLGPAGVEVWGDVR